MVIFRKSLERCYNQRLSLFNAMEGQKGDVAAHSRSLYRPLDPRSLLSFRSSQCVLAIDPTRPKFRLSAPGLRRSLFQGKISRNLVTVPDLTQNSAI
jgi:hypothetical protein